MGRCKVEGREVVLAGEGLGGGGGGWERGVVGMGPD